MSSQSNTSVLLKTMYMKKNLFVESVVTLFLLRLVVVLLEFFFPKKVLYLSLFQLKSKRNRFPLKEFTFFFNVIGYDYSNLSNIPCLIRKWLKIVKLLLFFFLDLLKIKLTFSACQVTFIVIAFSIALTLSNYFWVYCIQKKL